ncbi:MAG: cbb3-type cytochrome c oxidase subunit II, partial [Acidimicrobiia bacterium]
STDVTPTDDAPGIARVHIIVAAVFLVLGTLVATDAALQLVLPQLLSGIAFATFGKLAPAARLMLEGGWLTIGLLGMSYWALTKITGQTTRRSVLAYVSLGLITLGVVAGVVGILAGYQSGLPGLEAPVWARAISTLGYLLSAVAIVGTARASGDRLGAAGWYLTSAPIWLTLTAVVGLIPASAGVAGTIQAAFVTSGITGLFFITASVGLLYYVIGAITGTDPTETRPLAALGFWSLTVVWANMGAVALIYTAVPDWYETISIAFAIASLVPLLTIAGDIGLLLRGRVAQIVDRMSLRLAVIAGLSLAIATVVNLLWAWRATSVIVQYSTWVNAFEALVVLGGGSFALFAAVSVMNGRPSRAQSAHATISTLGFALAVVGLLVGGIVVGFSWAAGPASQAYANAGAGWKVTADSSALFLWIAALGTSLFAVGQIVFLFSLSGNRGDGAEASTDAAVYHLDFEGTPRYATWRRLIWGVVGVWLFAGLMTLVLPIVDDTDRDATLLADTYRTYDSGSIELVGRDLYISEGCIECHTQAVRPIGPDVGLGPVSVAGDYAHESPALLGAARFGPDLMHFASSGEFFDKVLVEASLRDPRSLKPGSSMPSYAYLSSEDLCALVIYIETLR